ncbi:hypothetical protein [Gordonia caeni]|uniref:DUF2613 family protein n=1 Tax=Gordonia caeni TaxID=1007097 RepID=A0ABP7NLK6_9ACTN
MSGPGAGASAAFTRPAVRIAVFVVGLCVVLGITFGIGRAVGPWDLDTAPTHDTHQNEQTTEVRHDGH